MKKGFGSRVWSSIINILTILLILFILFPFFFMVLTSLKTEAQTFTWPPLLLFEPRIDAYYKVLFTAGGGLGLFFPTYFFNSFVVSVGGSLLGMTIGLPVAYALARFPMKHKNATMFSFLSFRFMPPLVVSVAFLFMYTSLGLLDTHIGLILAYGLSSLPFVVLIMTSFIKQVPRDIVDSSLVDGCTEFRALIRAVLPLARPGIVATLILTTILNWNEFPLAFILTYEVARTIPVASAAVATTPERVRWDMLSALGTLAVIPMIILAILIQKHLVRGLTMGAVK